MRVKHGQILGVTTTEHAHAWAQENFVLSGKGEVYFDGKSTFL